MATQNDMTVTVQLKHQATEADRQIIFHLLEGYNASQAGPEPELPLAVLIHDDDGAIVGGLWGLTYYRWLFIELLFVPETLRHLGLGKQLMQEAEAEAVRRSCHGVWLDTFTFQARPFYEKLGYKVFGHVPDYPPGHIRWFMLKRLTAETESPMP